MRRGVSLLIGVLVAAACAAATARADSGTTTSTTTGTTTTPAPVYAPLSPSRLPKSCVGAGLAAISTPKSGTVTIGTPASSIAASDYPAAGPIVELDGATASGSKCGTGGVTVTGLSLFGGDVTATSVHARDGKGTVTGLAVDGTPVTAPAGDSVAVGGWVLVTFGGTDGRLTAPLVVELLRAHDSLPKGTTIHIGFAATAQSVVKTKPNPATTTTSTAPQAVQHKAKHQRRVSKVAQPLKWTPHLGLNASHYVFPVDTGASYVDTYGAGRNDIYDGWHHGDDLFAPLGTPVVAVANGKLSLVGWNALGGWRLWLTDAKGNSFYYAHLSGYSRWILHHRNVRAGEVVGFLGRTGDAYTTAPHLHFEIHPHQLIKLGYDGAVDPTTYLHAWRVETVPATEIPQPAKMRAPRGTPTQEAAVVWKQLLAARHLLPNGEKEVAFAALVRRPYPAERVAQETGARNLASVRTAAHVAPLSSRGDGPWPLLVLVGTLLASCALAIRAAAGRRRRSRTPLH